MVDTYILNHVYGYGCVCGNADAHESLKRASGPLELGFRLQTAQCGYWEWNPGPLQEQ